MLNLLNDVLWYKLNQQIIQPHFLLNLSSCNDCTLRIWSLFQCGPHLCLPHTVSTGRGKRVPREGQKE